jgi:signal transduction histidine kinase
MNSTSSATLSLAGSALFAFILIRGIGGRARQEDDRLRMLVYAAASALICLFESGVLFGWVSGFDTDFLNRIAIYFLIFSSLIFIDLTRCFLRLDELSAAGWGAGVALFAAIVALDMLPGLISLPEGFPPLTVLTVLSAALIWVVISARSGQLVLVQYRETRQPLHRNRITYWAVTLLLTVMGGIIVLGANLGVGNLLMAVGALVGGYAVYTHRPVDIRVGSFRVLGYVITTLLVLFVYTIVFSVAQFVFQNLLGFPVWVAGFSMALVLALIFRPMIGQIEKGIEHWLGRRLVDNSMTVREYSGTISNIIDIDQLGTVAMGLISEALENQKGVLFLVDQKEITGGKVGYVLNSVRGGMGLTEPEPGRVPLDSPIARYMTKQHKPLIQYDLDFLEDFKQATPEERSWFSRLAMDVHVPIYGHGLWIGMISIGPKTTGIPYSSEDLTLLSTLADQTSIALENARLVEGLVEVNKRVESAYSNLSRTKQELERLDRAKTDFISIASHELRTPLTVIHGYTQMLSDAPSVRENEYYRALTEGIQNGTARLAQIVDSMLDVAKIDNRELDLAPVPLPISTILMNLKQTFDRNTLERNLSLEIAPLDQLPPIEVDREAVQKVFHHLLMNAIKYTPDGGRIEITGKFIAANGAPNSRDCVQLTVRDTGIGIDPEHQKLIFRKFYQTGELALHSSGQSKFKGAGPGLGLAIALGVVDAHGGQIWVESPGHDEKSLPGSAFHVMLPVRQKSDQNGAAAG